jgi:hypothetical protein
MFAEGQWFENRGDRFVPVGESPDRQPAKGLDLHDDDGDRDREVEVLQYFLS